MFSRPVRRPAASTRGDAAGTPAVSGAQAVPAAPRVAHSIGTLPVAAPGHAPIQMMNNPPGAAIDEEEWGPFQGAGDQQGAAANNAPPAPVAGGDWQPNFPPVAHVAQQPVVVPVQAPPAPNHGPHVATGQSEVSNGPMHTTGLANCTALVAHNAQTGQARLYHWNTATAMTSVPIHPDDEGDPTAPKMLQPIPERFQEARARVDAGVPEPRTYHIAPGGMWGPGGFTPQSTQNFHAGLAEHFPGATVHPGAHGTARWANGQLTGH